MSSFIFRRVRLRIALCCLFASLCCKCPLLAQGIVPPAQQGAPAGTQSTGASADPYAAEPIVVERSETLMEMHADGTGYRERTLVARLQSDAAIKKYSVLTISYASATEHVDLVYARVRHADDAVVETQVSDALDMPSAVTQRAPFYSDQKEIQLPMRSLRVGDKLELKYRITRIRAEIPNQFWGQENLGDPSVVLASSIELRVPSGIYLNVWSPGRKPTESVMPATGNSPALHVYRWTYSQLKPSVGKDAEAEIAARKKILWTPEEEMNAKLGRLPTIAWTTFKSWQQIGDWYRSLEADRIEPDDTVRAKAAELIAGKTTEEGKVQALYTYVSTNIRYIGVAFGIGRFQPHTAAEVLSNQYGDCKDKHTLLAALLAASGIQSEAVLIGPGIRFNDAVPSPAAFDHLITHLTLEGKPVWLDATAEVAPYGMLTYPTRDKQALMIPGPRASLQATIVRTPADAPVPNFTTLVATGSLDASGVSTSRISLSIRGDAEILARTLFRSISPTQYDQAAQAFAKAMAFPGTATDSEVSRPTETSQSFKLAFDYKREKAGDWEHLRTIPQFFPVLLPRVTEMEPPNHAIPLGVPRSENSTADMSLPDGWSALMPADVHASSTYGTYDMTFHLSEGKIHAERHLVILAKEVPVSDWKTYQTFIDKVNPGREPYIQLRPHGTVKTVPEQRTKPIEDALNSSDPVLKNGAAYALALSKTHLADAQTLAEQAVDLQEKVAAKQVSLKDKVKSFDQMGVLGTDWETLGWIYYQQNDFDKATAYMRAAWELKPKNANIEFLMGVIFQAAHKPEEAKTYFRMALSGISDPKTAILVETRLTAMGADLTPLPMDVITQLPGFAAPSVPMGEIWVDVLLSHDHSPAVDLLKGDAAMEKPLTVAIQSALADALPDAGPEKVLRRGQILCSSGNIPACTLHFIGSQVASEATAFGKLH